MLPRSQRLPAHFIPLLMKQGRRIDGERIQLLFYPATHNKYAVIVPTRLSKKAVARNRTKRLIVETLHNRLSTIKSGYYILIMAKRVLATEKLQDIEPEVEELLRKANLIVTI